jgi:hypothetical protein
MTTGGSSACACSVRNPRIHPPRPDGAGCTDSQPLYILLSRRIAQAVSSGLGLFPAQRIGAAQVG